MNTYINQLIYYAFQHHMIEAEDKNYAINLLLDLFHIKDFHEENIKGEICCREVLDHMLDYAVEKGLIEDTITQRDLFDTRIMNCVMPRPSEVIRDFQYHYEHSPKEATDAYYQLSKASQYIRQDRTDKNIRFQHASPYGNLEITINLSKPEKDPKEIAKAKLIKKSNYPKCALCKENVGFSGDLQRAARQTHRIIPIHLGDTDYYLQYSPYAYYNEHCIVLNKEHIPMQINKDTFVHLLDFVTKFPHYMLGSNADLPIVGGSILTHDHYQGGCYSFPIQHAKVIETISLKDYPHLKIEILRWPLSTIRVTSANKQEMIDYACHVLDRWIDYNNESLDILAYSNTTRHNTITPIARRVGDDYQMDLVLRNNRTSEQYPDGIFHPHQNLHHIKKENIGLIEVMGLAILPARLKTELQDIKDSLLAHKEILEGEALQKHQDWYQELKVKQSEYEDIDDLIKDQLTVIFTHVLEDAGVFKMNEKGIQAFIKFVKEEDK